MVLASGRYLTRRDVSSVTKTMLSKVGEDPSCYNTHTYCIDAATTAAMVGVPDYLIKHLDISAVHPATANCLNQGHAANIDAFLATPSTSLIL